MLKPMALAIGWGVVLGSSEYLGLPPAAVWLLRGFFVLSVGVAVLSRAHPPASPRFPLSRRS